MHRDFVRSYVFKRKKSPHRQCVSFVIKQFNARRLEYETERETMA